MGVICGAKKSPVSTDITFLPTPLTAPPPSTWTSEEEEDEDEEEDRISESMVFRCGNGFRVYTSVICTTVRRAPDGGRSSDEESAVDDEGPGSFAPPSEVEVVVVVGPSSGR